MADDGTIRPVSDLADTQCFELLQCFDTVDWATDSNGIWPANKPASIIMTGSSSRDPASLL